MHRRPTHPRRAFAPRLSSKHPVPPPPAYNPPNPTPPLYGPIIQTHKGTMVDKGILVLVALAVGGLLALLVFVQIKKPLNKCRAVDVPPTQSASASSTPSKPTLDTSGLTKHNTFRALYGVSELVWNATTAKSAAAHAVDCKFAHDPTDLAAKGEGENLCSGTADLNGCIGIWEGENRLYDYAKPGFYEETGHFTQMVWSTTTDVGCAESPCDGRPLIVCRYYPPGNYLGEFAAKVPRPLK